MFPILSVMGDRVIRLHPKRFKDLPARTSDDVTITKDGRRLDTKKKVLAWLDELAEIRASSPSHRDDEPR